MHVTICSVDRNGSVELDIDPDSSFEDLKEHTAELFGFPPLFQRLLVKDSEPAASESLRAYGPKSDEEQPLAVTLVLSLDCLEDEDVDVRSTAVLALDGLAERVTDPSVRDRAVMALCCLLQDPSSPVRRLVLKTLGEITDRGDQRIVAASLKSLNDSEPHVICAALELLSKSVEQGDADVVATVITCLESAPIRHGEDVTFASVRALGAVARKGDAVAVGGLAKALASPNGYLRLLVLDVLSVVAVPGDRDLALPAVRNCLTDQQANMRRKAVEVLVSLAGFGGGRADALAALSASLSDASQVVRCAALAGICTIVTSKAEAATADAAVAIAAAMAPAGGGDSSCGEVDGCVASPVELQAAFSAACTCICSADSDANVRYVGLEVFGKLKEVGARDAALQTAQACLEDEDSDVREAAAELLESLGISGSLNADGSS